MEVRQLNTLIRAAQFQSFSKAAESLGYSQSAVTVQIKALEEKKATAEFTVAKKADTTNGSNNATADQTTAQKTKVLKTGDESPVGYLLALLALFGAAVVFTGKKGYLK